uniref:Iaa-alanine resistance protein n=1 Tax=Rhizophora mucronata TaxID=61149 RepID=A0A2P2MUY9_RHIMU
MTILVGIVIFLVEKVVQYVEDNSTGSYAWSHGLCYCHQKSSKKLEDNPACQSANGSGRNGLDEFSNNPLNANVTAWPESLPQNRNVTLDKNDGRTEDTVNGFGVVKSLNQEDSEQPPSNLVFGYLNLFSDGVHNFTDGMDMGSAFLLYGSVAGWSGTLFLLVHELPQEVDFSILVRSGFSVSKALFFNFLSVVAVLAGIAVVLLWGQDPRQSSFIEK